MSRRLGRKEKAAIERAGLLSRLATENFYAMPLEQLRRVVAAIDEPTLTDAERDALEFFGSGSDRARASELLMLVGSIAGLDGAVGMRAEIRAEWAELLDDFTRHGGVVRGLLARLGGGA